MKIKFTKLPTTDGTIKVSLDGGQSFTEHNIADIHESSIPLSDDQDYQKIKIKGPANILKNLDIVSSVKVEGAEAGSTSELSFIINTDTYGFAFPDCVTGIIIPNGLTTIGIDPNAIIPIFDGGGKGKELPAKGYYSANNVFCLFPNLQTIVIPESVTTIGDNAFYDCSNLTSITIPDSVTSIGQRAFQNCSSLTSVTLGNSVTSISNNAFQRCSGLTSVTIPDSVTSICDGTFAGCSSLTSIIIPDSVTSIGGYAFRDCTSLASITIPDSVTSIGEYAFQNCTSLTSITIPESVTSISEGAFADCTSLESINIPESVTSIDRRAFSGCPLKAVNASQETMNRLKIGHVVIEDGVTEIGDNAFGSCESLTSITIPDSVTSIGQYAFYYCTSLTSITIPESVTSISDGAFYNCSSLTSIIIPDSVTSIGGYAFQSCESLKTIYYRGTEEQWNAINKGADWNNYCPSDMVINYNYGKLISKNLSDSVIATVEKTTLVISGSGKIPEKSYIDCTELTTLIINNGITEIGLNAFSGCTNLTSVNIGRVECIQDSAFEGCSSLESINISEYVESIGNDAFKGCKGLKSITVDADNMYYRADDGVLYNKDKTVLITYPANKESDSFVLPKSVRFIYNSAFDNCKNLKTINYAGTEEEWNKISKGNADFSNVTVNYNYQG